MLFFTGLFLVIVGVGVTLANQMLPGLSLIAFGSFLSISANVIERLDWILKELKQLNDAE